MVDTRPSTSALAHSASPSLGRNGIAGRHLISCQFDSIRERRIRDKMQRFFWTSVPRSKVSSPVISPERYFRVGYLCRNDYRSSDLRPRHVDCMHGVERDQRELEIRGRGYIPTGNIR
jgi:hypothetical protein